MDADRKKGYFVSDEAFDSLYPIYIQKLSAVHWTPLSVAHTAANFLAGTEHRRILDIGAGVGKFCIAGAYYTNAFFTGIEQRRNFVKAGTKVASRLSLDHVSLLHGNFMDVDLRQFNGIYFFNSFHENLVISDSLDDKIERSPALYEAYTSSLFARLEAMPLGTRLATYWLTVNEVPGNFRLCESLHGDKLKLWMKIQ